MKLDCAIGANEAHEAERTFGAKVGPNGVSVVSREVERSNEPSDDESLAWRVRGGDSTAFEEIGGAGLAAAPRFGSGFERRQWTPGWSTFMQPAPAHRNSNSPAGTFSARCPDCHCELPLTIEQSMLLASGAPVWPFCPVCTRIVRGEAFHKTKTEPCDSNRLRPLSAAPRWQPHAESKS
jgi:hypothetical protein